MALPAMVFSVLGVAALALTCARNWHTAVLLAVIELVWVALCGVYGAALFATGDLFFLAWACIMLFFSAAELILSAVLFASQARATSETAPLKVSA